MRSALSFVFVTVAYASCYDYEYYDAATGATVGSACDGPPVRAPSPATLPGQAPNQLGTPPPGALSIPPTPNAPVVNQLGTLPGVPAYNAPAANPYPFSQFDQLVPSWPTSGSPVPAATFSSFSGQFGALTLPSTSGFATPASQTFSGSPTADLSSAVISPYTGTLLASSSSAVPFPNALPYEFPVLYGAPLGQSSQTFPSQFETTFNSQSFNSFNSPPASSSLISNWASGPIYSSALVSSPYASILDNAGALAGPAVLGPLYSAPLAEPSVPSPYISSSFPLFSAPFSNTLSPISGSVTMSVPFSSEVLTSPSLAAPYVAPSFLNDLYKPTVIPFSPEVSVVSPSPAPYVASSPASVSSLPVSTAYKSTVARTLSTPLSTTQAPIPSLAQQVLVTQPVPPPVQVRVSQPVSVPVPVQQVRITQPVPVPVPVRITQPVPQPVRVVQAPRSVSYSNSRGSSRYVQSRLGSVQQRFMGMGYYGPQQRYG